MRAAMKQGDNGFLWQAAMELLPGPDFGGRFHLGEGLD
jgi:hypothetical protein